MESAHVGVFEVRSQAGRLDILFKICRIHVSIKTLRCDTQSVPLVRQLSFHG